MSETKFTPGEWRYRPGKYDDWGVVRCGDAFICQAKDPRINYEDLHAFREMKLDPWEANAHLIAAAPDLYAALDQILDDMGDDGLSCCQAAKDQARAALSRARGET